MFLKVLNEILIRKCKHFFLGLCRDLSKCNDQETSNGESKEYDLIQE